MVDRYTRATFQALVDAIIPATPILAATLGSEQAAGAIDLCIYEYVIQELNHSRPMQDDIPFSKSTALLLDSSAIELLRKGFVKHFPHVKSFPGGGPFSALRRSDRLRAIDQLDQLDIELHSLPLPYQENTALIQTMMNSLNQITMFGYYAGWSGARTGCFPLSWIQVGYPGQAFGYRDFRGYLLRFPLKGGKS
ncbi:hypothetical protein [Ammoniphilus sp. 3BR4]|uniref:hypothetical protein n=1 Tax=Ammoniphilus sp. 3BR4 TaxID=3158265 RepID=UPI00346741A2